MDLIPVLLFSTDLLLRRASEVKACEQYTEAYYLFTYLCLYFVVCFVFYFRLRRENEFLCGVPLCFQRAPLGVTVVLCYQIQRGWAVKCLLCRVFWAPLCRGIGAGVHEGIKGNQQIFNLIKILDYSGSPDTEKHEIQNILTPVSMKRSYLCSRGSQIYFSSANAFSLSHDVIMHA